MEWGVVAIVLIWIAFAWAMLSLTRTGRQRMEILNSISTAAREDIDNHQWDWERYYDRFGKVSYGKHWFMVATFQDPNRLYKGLFE